MYPTPIPSTTPLANPSARALVPTAGPIADRTPLDPADVVAACTETKAKENLPPGVITDRELAEVKIRETRVLGAHAFGADWFGEAVASAIAQALQPVLVRALQPLTARIDGLAEMSHVATARIDGLTYRIDNWETFRLNRQSYQVVGSARITTRQAVLTPLVKTVPGQGAGLPNGPHLPVAPDIVAVGERLPAPPFPVTVAELEALSQRALQRISIQLNNTFGVLPGDEWSVRLEKFRVFITGA